MLDANDPRLTAYLLGELDAAERQAFETEMAGSPELQQAVDQLRQTSEQLTDALAHEQCPSLRPEQHEAIERTADQLANGESPAPVNLPSKPQGRSWGAVAVLAAAAALVLVVLSVAGWQQLGTGGTAVVPRSNDGPTGAAVPAVQDPWSYDDESSLDLSPRPPGNSRDNQWNSFAPEESRPEFGQLPNNSAVNSGLLGGVPEGERSVDGRNRELGDAPPAPTSQPESLSLPGDADRPAGSGPGADPAPLSNIMRRPVYNTPFSGESNRASDGDARLYRNDGSTVADPTDQADDAGGEARVRPADGGFSGEQDGKEGEGRPRTRASSPRRVDDLTTELDEESEPGQKAAEKSGKDPSKEAKPDPPATWRRSQIVPNASRLRVGDRDDLPLQGMQVNVVVDGFRARVLLDCYYYNNQPRQLEGSFQLRLPTEASLYYFAFGEAAFEYRPMVDQLASRGFLPADVVRSSGTGPDGIRKARSDSWTKVKEARLVPREKAAHAYSEVVRRRVDPALVEWSGAGVFQAKVFPLMPNKLHRIVIGYDVNLQQVGDDLEYRLDLPEDIGERTVDLDVAAFPGTEAEVTGDARPFVSGGRAYYHFPEPPREISVRVKAPGTLLLKGEDAKGSKFFASRFTPELPADEAQTGASEAVFLVDTSLSSNPDKFNIWLRMLESSLNENRDSMERFAVLFFNVEAHWWKDGFQKNTPANVEALLRHCRTLALEGATNLEQAVQEAVAPSWPKGQRRAKGPDLFLLSDGAITWGGRNQHRLAAELQNSGSTLFAYNTGLNGSDGEMLEHLARESGGSVFRVTGEAEVVAAAKAHRQRPWQLLNATVPGSNDVLIAGRPRSIYPGQSLLLVGRGEVDAEATLKLRRGDQVREVPVAFRREVKSELAARMYGQVAVGQLENLGDNSYQMSVAYARHFRVTGNTCSLLMLESEADYQRFNIRPEDDAFVVKSSPVDPLVVRKLDELAGQLDDPKAVTLQWLKKLEQTAGMQFKIPVALQLSLEQMPRQAFEVTLPKLVCKQRSHEDLPKNYFQHLDSTELDYEVIVKEADRRQKSLGNADALKALSSLIERNPGDPVLTQDVAFTAIQWGYGGQAYPLLQRVAKSRPYLPHIYPALAQCVADLGNADLAMVYYEVALNGKWHQRYRDVREIATVQYAQLLRRIVDGELDASAKDFARARLDNLNQQAGGRADLVVVMMWNTDRTDVDLHVVEPNGDECYYKNRNTRAGGKITHDVTEGFGPEMYRINKAAGGRYRILANYYGSDVNRTQLRTKVFVTVYENFGQKDEKIHRHTVLLSNGKEKRELASVVLEK